MDKSHINRVYHQANKEYNSFLIELQKLEILEYPTPACQEFLQDLKSEAIENQNKIRKIAKKALGAIDGSVDIKLEVDQIRAVRAKLIKTLTVYLDWVRGAQTLRVPWSFIPSAERLAEAIISNNNKTILYCENKYNYRIVWCDNPDSQRRLEKYCFVSLPRLHRTNILMHAWVGHELFHPLCKEFTEKFKSEAGKNIASETKKAYSDQLDPNTLWGQKELARRSKLLMFAWERALQELLCDMALATVFGPAGLLAMRAFALFSDAKAKVGPESQFYPPWQYRFEVVWEQAIDKAGLKKLWKIILGDQRIGEIGSSFKTEVERFGASLKSKEGLKHVSADKFYYIAYKEVNRLVPEAQKYVVSKLPESISRWSDDQLLEQLPGLVSRLQNGIPPNEIPNITYDKKRKKGVYRPEPAELSSILIAGWMYQIHRERVYDKRKVKLLSFETLCRLLLKACEDSEMIFSS